VRSLLVVGASLAGLRGVEAVRRDGFDGTVTLIGDEPHAPYDRPPLSKQVLSGDWDADKTGLADADRLAELDVTFRSGVAATAFDAASRTVTLADGSWLSADGVMIATGARTRRIPGTDGLAGVHTLRTLDDSLAIRADLDAAPRRVVVVGAGFIGAEVAATARERGLEVTIVEMAEVPLVRAIGAAAGEVVAEVHRDHGVDVRLGVGVSTIEGDSRVERVTLDDGTVLDADVVVVGVGVQPNTEWLDGSGLTIENGVVCDETCLAAPGVTAAGDVARWPNPLFGEMMRVEHWDNAVEQGAHAARRLLADGPGEPFAPVPWFWSDQYDRKIQLAGRCRPDDVTELVTGTFEERRFALIYGREGRITAVLGFNRPRHVMKFRQLIAEKGSWDAALELAREMG
jgi:NADPH-dependent 2,4-dienoyl-CoA reductase/sulfur reductase-like enzyme